MRLAGKTRIVFDSAVTAGVLRLGVSLCLVPNGGEGRRGKKRIF